MRSRPHSGRGFLAFCPVRDPPIFIADGGLLRLTAFLAYGLEPLAMTINQETLTLAEMIGATRNRVNFLMNKFRGLGLVNYNRKARSSKGPAELRFERTTTH
jgi:hypothetical protein